MSKLKKEVLKVKLGQRFTFVGVGDYFTNGRGDYEVVDIDYDNGSQTTKVAFYDDESDFHAVTDSFFTKNFVPTIVKNFRHV